MADDIIDAHEQSERARQWLQQNGSSIVIGVLLGLAVLMGWQRWQQSGVSHRAEALAKFEQLEEAAGKDDQELVGKLVDDLRHNYSDTAHAGLAALEQAEMLLKGGKLDEAESALKFAADSSKQASIRSIAATRLARVQIARAEPQKALDTLKTVTLEGYAAEVDAIRGDAYAALGKTDEAVKAYDAALAATDVAAPQRRTIEVKRDDLKSGVAVAAKPAEQG